ncbi:peptidoglycan DD-metalloendopeptidase family protein [Synechocystis salina]|uniref:Peptidoglycan DD-metalloendopeptidase family protein n=1 Tax=Synechocystis salina LEGE 00031 TaxID=1828736 RepID=A0ABR9VT05_9SYNC|nr:peptidoglycan DD-metalloendopeptidase family protein [Synechocystis salina]MBE9240365.1 peptidoglycan DD-metalloendopeptidase family protein [Synechocystis salina LEGE 00041]MBE9253598.1 peptidoglycan DD-metalloendopeptidase family protein [Synechocystis salina LEGE 00031]
METSSYDGSTKQEGTVPLGEGYRRVRRSAAMVGLAVSMGATGMLFSQTATAATSSGNSPLAAVSNLSLDQSHGSPTESVLASPSLKHQVKEGESLWQISQAFQVDAKAIALANSISTDTALQAGQVLSIPRPSSSVKAANDQAPAATIPPLAPLEQTDSLVVSSSLAPGQSSSTANTIAVKPKAQTLVADVSRPMQGTVVEPLEEKLTSQRIKSTAEDAGIKLDTKASLPSPVEVAAAAHGDRPIPIAVVAPEEFTAIEVQPSSSPANPQSMPVPTLPAVAPAPSKAQRQDESLASGEDISLDNLRQNGMAQPAQPVQTALNIDQPVAIAVIPPETTPAIVAQPALPGTPVVLETSPAIAALPSTPTVTPDVDGQISYQVKPGDTLSQIARSHDIQPEKIQQANGLSNPDEIKAEQILVIPPPTTVAAVPESVTPSLPSFVSTQPTAQTMVARAQEEPEAQYQTQLKAEVTQLNQTQPTRTPMVPQRAVTVARQVNNEAVPDWQARSPQALPVKFNQPRQDLAQLQRQYSPQGQRSQFSTSVGQSQIIGAAPSPVQGYNDSIQIPVIQEVSPELPGLSTPDFPRGPAQFNGYIWPAKGVFTSGFGPRWGRMHRGIDIAAPIGTPIMAAASGEVVFSGWNSGGFGNLVKIRHGDGSVTYYAHNNRLLVRRGEYVEQGQQIAEMGSTGRSTGPHLHFEIRVGGTNAVNPVALLPRSR